MSSLLELVDDVLESPHDGRMRVDLLLQRVP
jgi:hypothetical protein